MTTAELSSFMREHKLAGKGVGIGTAAITQLGWDAARAQHDERSMAR